MSAFWLEPYLRLIKVEPLALTYETDKQKEDAELDVGLFVGCCERCLDKAYETCPRLHILALLVICQYLRVVCGPVITQYRQTGGAQRSSPLIEAWRRIWKRLKREFPTNQWYRLHVDRDEICHNWIAANVFEVHLAALASGWTANGKGVEHLMMEPTKNAQSRKEKSKREKPEEDETEQDETEEEETEEENAEKEKSGEEKPEKEKAWTVWRVRDWITMPEKCRKLFPNTTSFEFTARTLSTTAPTWRCPPIQQWEWNARHARFDERAKLQLNIIWWIAKRLSKESIDVRDALLKMLEEVVAEEFAACFEDRQILTVDSTGLPKKQCGRCHFMYGDMGLIFEGSEKLDIDKQNHQIPWQCAEEGLWAHLSDFPPWYDFSGSFAQAEEVPPTPASIHRLRKLIRYNQSFQLVRWDCYSGTKTKTKTNIEEHGSDHTWT